MMRKRELKEVLEEKRGKHRLPVIRLLSEPTMGLSKAGVGLTLAVSGTYF